MAVSLGVVRGFLRAETTSYAKLRNIRLLTTATDSKPATEPTKPRHVSPKMQCFLGGVSENPKAKANKKMWAYIKKQIRQDPEVQKIVIRDEKLKRLPCVEKIVTIIG